MVKFTQTHSVCLSHLLKFWQILAKLYLNLVNFDFILQTRDWQQMVDWQVRPWHHEFKWKQKRDDCNVLTVKLLHLKQMTVTYCTGTPPRGRIDVILELLSARYCSNYFVDPWGLEIMRSHFTPELSERFLRLELSISVMMIARIDEGKMLLHSSERAQRIEEPIAFPSHWMNDLAWSQHQTLS